MNLETILNRLGTLEKNSFIKVIDNIISNNPKNLKQIETILTSFDNGLKSIDNKNIVKIFNLISDEFYNHIKKSFLSVNSQFDIFVDLLIKDTCKCISRDWFYNLYEAEIKDLKKDIKSFTSDIEDEKSEITNSKKRDYKIYKSCLKAAYYNDEDNNQEAKITSDELSILLTLSQKLGLSQEEIIFLNYSILPIEKKDVKEVIKNLKNLGVIFHSNKEDKIFVADEMVAVLRKVRGIEIPKKYFRRALKAFKPSDINKIAKNNNIDKKLDNDQKIEEIIKKGINFSNILLEDIHNENDKLADKKKKVHEIFENNLGFEKIKGATIEEKVQFIIGVFNEAIHEEKMGIAIDGFRKLLSDLNDFFPKLNDHIRKHYNFKEEFILDSNFLADFDIKPRDILDLIKEEELKPFIIQNKIKQRGDKYLNILEKYKDVENLLIENFEAIGYRNLSLLKENGIIIKEANLGVKFEELTKKIFIGLKFNVDEALRKKVNTSNDLVDVIINLDNSEVIIIECKTIKEKGYNKFTAVSRQLKSYQNLLEKNGYRVVKVLLIAPEFSDDFIYDCEMNTEINLSLLTASTLLNIYKTFITSKQDKFPYFLFRDILIDEERIIKALNK